MCTVLIAYFDAPLDTFEHIKEIHYLGNDNSLVTVSAEDVTTYEIPIGCPLWLLSQNRIFCVACDHVRYIEVVKET